MAGRLFGWPMPRIRTGICDSEIAQFAGEAVSVKENSLRLGECGKKIVDVIFINIGGPHDLLEAPIPIEHIVGWDYLEKVV